MADRILIVDDREDNVYLLRALLEGHGYEVTVAANGAEALDAARRSPPDLMVSDILMPVMDGFALCREWKGDADLRSIPLIFYTATYTDEKDREFALSLGADRFVVKPQEPDELLAIVRGVLKQARVRLTGHAEPEGAEPASTDERPGGDERVYLKRYNEALIRKLEAKMEQLERANSELEADIAARRAAEAEIHRLNQTLEQRVAARTEQLEAANAELKAFSYSASHDLRAPLRAIDGYANILLEDYGPSLDDEGRRVCMALSRNAHTMSKLLDGLLAFSRIGHADMHPTTLDMAVLASAVFQEITTVESRKRIDFHVGLLPPATGDSLLLREVWTNLLGNAVKFSSKRERAHIEVEAERRGDDVVYSVRDDGAGFDMEYAAKAFDVFRRLHKSEEFEGTGLGLAIVQRIVIRHGGRVWAEGEPDHGATVNFTLPADGCGLAT